MFIVGRIAAVAMCAALSIGPLTAQDPKPAARPHPPAAHPASQEPAKQAPVKDAVTYVVVRSGESYQVMTKTAFDDLERQRKDQFQKDHAAWEKAKKDAADARTKFDTPAPRLQPMHVVHGDYPTQAAADAAVQKMVAKEKADAEKKAEEAAHRTEKSAPTRAGTTPPKHRGGGAARHQG